MSLEYCLVDNKLTPDEDDCMARVQDVKMVGIEELTQAITGRGMSLTDTEVQAVLNELTYAINDQLQAGNAISTPFVRINPSIGGVFDNKDDVFDHARHSIRLNTSLGNGIAVDATKLKATKVKADLNVPEINSLLDYQTQRSNEVLTRNSTVEIKGHNLKVDPNDPEQGIFIKSGGQTVRVQMYMLNKPTHIIFMVPNDAPGGAVELEVRNSTRKGSAIRTSVFGTSLTIS